MSMRNTKTAQSPRVADPIVEPPDQISAPRIDAAFLKATMVRRWKLILATAVLVTIVAGILAALHSKHYRASAIAGVTTTGDHMDAGELYRGVEVLQQRTIVATVAALASIPETRRQAFAPFSIPQGEYTIDAIVLPNTNLLRIDVEGTDPVAAARIANRVPAILATQTRSMYKLYGVATVSEATPPTTSVTPRFGRALLAGAIIGLLIGMAAALAKSYLRLRRSTATFTDAVPAM
jgi:capsular polysaccharide biosynthesis protein